MPEFVSVRDSNEKSYEKVKGISGICRSSRTLEEAQKMVREVYPGENLDEIVEAVGHYLKSGDK